MIEFIKSIYGPNFLLVYIGFSFAVIYLTYWFAKKDGTEDLPIPEPTKYTPFVISLLTNGIKGSISLAVFSLWQKKKIEIEETGKGSKLKIAQSDTKLIGDNELETFVLQQVNKGNSFDDLFKKSLFDEAKRIMKPYSDSLTQLRLLRGTAEIERLKSLTIRATIILLMFSGVKLYFGIMRDKPVAFLVILMILSVIILYTVIKPTKIKPTVLGEKFLKQANQRFEWLKTSKDESVLQDENLLYGVATFGLTAFALTAAGSILAEPANLYKRNYPNTGSDSVSGGCSSDTGSSSDSGSGCSSDSGSGCGGSGCGGCGGD